MQMRKFYGRTMSAAVAQVKRELGPDALILETGPIAPDSPSARLNPEARYEVLAARDPRQPAPPKPAAHETKPQPAPGACPGRPAPFPSRAVVAPRQQRKDLLEDLGLLRSQINQLLEGDPAGGKGESSQMDLGDYHSLIDQGVDHTLLAPHFRRWLEWRTTPAAHRGSIAQLQGGAAHQMHGESLREWLWLVWSENLGLAPAETREPAPQATGRPRVMALVGPTGAGKTTTLAKLSSISRRSGRQNAVVLTLDTFRFGATEQWRRMGRLMGIEVEEIVSQADISKSMERWGQYDWVGIDTPGGLTPESAGGILYGSILAQYPAMESVLVLPATQQEAVSREHLKRYRALGARKVLFSKMDESTHNGGIINLTMDGKWKIDSFATGSRIPEDWERVSRESLWNRVLAPQALQGGAQ